MRFRLKTCAFSYREMAASDDEQRMDWLSAVQIAQNMEKNGTMLSTSVLANLSKWNRLFYNTEHVL